MQQQLYFFNFSVFSFAFLVNAPDNNYDIGQHYNAEKMRFRFVTCINNDVVNPLPCSIKRMKVRAANILFADVYCVSRRLLFEYEVDQDPKMSVGNCSKCSK